MNQRFWGDRIQSLTPYVPGEQPKDRVFIKLNTNENPYPPAPEVIQAISRATGDALRLYPDPEASALRQALAEHYGLKPEQVFCGNGSDEVLGLCFYAFFTPGKPVVFPDITYSFYPVYARLFQLDFEEKPLNADLSIPVDALCGSNGGVVLCNPNAPTGMALPLSEVRRILEANPDVVVMVDEAYVDFGGESAVCLIPHYPNLLVVHTMSKSRSLAGVRIGYAMGHEDLIAAVNCVKNCFNSYPLDQLALAAGQAALSETAYYETTCAQVMATRERTTARLRALGFLVHDSKTNFIFISHPDHSAQQMQLALRERGILVRWFSQPRIQAYLRVSIGTDAEMDTFCAALDEILKEND